MQLEEDQALQENEENDEEEDEEDEDEGGKKTTTASAYKAYFESARTVQVPTESESENVIHNHSALTQVTMCMTAIRRRQITDGSLCLFVWFSICRRGFGFSVPPPNSSASVSFRASC